MKNILLKRHLMWVLAPFAVYFFSELIKAQLGNGAHLFKLPSDMSNLVINEFHRRSFVMTTALVFTAISFAVMVITGRNLWLKFAPKELIKFTFPFIFILFMGLWTSGVIGSANQVTQKDNCESQIEQKNSLFINSDKILGSVRDGDCIKNFFDAALNASQPNLADQFEFLFLWISILLILTISLVIFGAIGCLSHPEDEKEDDQTLTNLKSLENNLFFTAILLISGVVFYHSWMSWPGYVLTNNTDDLMWLDKIVHGMTLYTGLTYSLMIAAYFIPIRSILVARLSDEIQSQRREKSKTVRTENEREMHPFFAWLSSMLGTSDHQKEFFSYTLKILSPIVVAWFTTFLGSAAQLTG